MESRRQQKVSSFLQEILSEVYRVIQERKQNPSEKSYVASLHAKGLDKILGKIGEEATEVSVLDGPEGAGEENRGDVTSLHGHHPRSHASRSFRCVSVASGWSSNRTTGS